jgi:beta-N-acetylhexosaminidase
VNNPDGIILSVNNTELTEVEKKFFKRTKPFGFVLFKRNFKNYVQIKNLILELKDSTINKSPLIFIDQEGGEVQRLRGNNFTDFPPQKIFGDLYEINENKALTLSYLTSYLIGNELKEIGVDVNFSPVCDLFFDNAHKIIGNRSFGKNPEVVNKLVSQYCKGLTDSGVFPVLKHFPGHGRSKIDTHNDVSCIRTDLNTLKETDLIPFLCLKEETFVMLAHITYPAIDSEIATYSKEINKLLRDYNSFNGLIITDDISMKGLTDNLETIVKRSYDAGCDIILYCSGKIDEMKRIYPLSKPISQKYFNFFQNKLKTIDPKVRQVENIRRELKNEGII